MEKPEVTKTAVEANSVDTGVTLTDTDGNILGGNKVEGDEGYQPGEKLPLVNYDETQLEVEGEEDLEKLKAFYGEHLKIEEDKKEEKVDDGVAKTDAANTDTPGAADKGGGEVSKTAETEVLTPEQIADLKKAAEFGQLFNSNFAKDPKGTIAKLMNNQALTPEDREDLVKQAAVIPAVAFDPKSYEADSNMEAAMLPHWDFISNGAKKITEALIVRDNDIQFTYAQAKGLEAKVDALLEVLGVQLPAYDPKPVYEFYNKSTDDLTIADAIQKTYSETLKKAVVVAKQQRVERPKTLGSVPADTPAPKINSIADAYEAAGVILQMED